MKITILAIGRMKDKALASLQQEYCKRLQSFARIEILEVHDEPDRYADRPAETAAIKEKEAARALAHIQADDYVILLDLHGTECSSEEFAARLRDWQLRSLHLVFVIAGSLGPGTSLVSRADVRWKLSSLTFPHLLTRILLLEQIYRGFMINDGRRYHK